MACIPSVSLKLVMVKSIYYDQMMIPVRMNSFLAVPFCFLGKNEHDKLFQGTQKDFVANTQHIRTSLCRLLSRHVEIVLGATRLFTTQWLEK